MSTISASTTTTTAYKVTADTTGTLVLQTGATPTTAVTIDTSQNVGIGTSSVNTTANKTLEINGAAGTDSAVNLSVNGTRYGIHYAATSIAVSGSYANIPYAFYTNNTERARIDTSGNLLVGVTSTTPGNARGFSVTSVGAGEFRVFHSTSDGSGDPFGRFIYNGTQIGSIIQSGTTGVLYNITSDYRLKTVIGPVAGAGERIDALEPIEYEWKSDGSRTRGFLAHKFQEVYPQSVSGEKDAVDEEGNPQYQNMQAGTSEVIADLIAEIQSLRQRLAALENK